ncbi:RNA polymerase I-specific transcription initiation factor RRN3 [Coccinella septempunctata]|uniref:RNA polymerase I-specific transcription initiation factor RRN3 n=1 Tax=Coccinella septempunctata TaxID=41139 RepID=UPI001D0742C0|nr:RNA polymerase I-specific transcription initiation factor RRN3 [Coccinella septempunctata]
MSLCSGHTLTPSILKKSSTIQERIQSTPKSTTKVRFVLPHSQNVRKILRDFLKHNNTKDYQHLICLIRDSELTDDDLSSLLKECTECISLMNNDLRLFTEVLLTIQWANRDIKLVKEYQSFLNNLLVAHTYHAKIVIDNLVSLFLQNSNEVWENGEPTHEDDKKFSNVHKVLKTLFRIVPMCMDMMVDALQRHYPYFRRGVHVNDCYLYNLLKVLDYAPSLKAEILDLIFLRLVNMDVGVPRDLIEKVYSDVDEDIVLLDEGKSCSNNNLVSPDKVVVETLDICLRRIFRFIHKVCHNPETGDFAWNETKEFYKNTLKIFDGIVLPTYNCHHIQFCWFLLFSFKPCLAEIFIDHLWQKVTDPSISPVLRQTSVQYIASLVARASYVNLRLLKNVLQQLSSWIHSYINAQDDVECVNWNLKVHSVFYSTCQALFYVTFFRHKEMIASNKNLSFLQNLNFSKIVTCRLNPLRVCQPAVVQNFAAFTRNYQLAYCHAIIEHNSRTTISTIYQNQGGLGMAQTNDVLDANYPFDPFVLKRCSGDIKPFYRVYEEFDLKRKAEAEETNEIEMDDFIDQTYVSNKRKKFSYGSSPGFKFNL